MLLARPSRAAGVRNFVIGTGDPTGTYYPVGGVIADIVSAPPGGNPCPPGRVCGVPGLVAFAQSSAGTVANLESLAARRVDSIFAQADVAHEAWQGQGPFVDAPFEDLRALASLYPEVAQLVVLEEAPWPPRRLAVGGELSGTSVSAPVVLPAFGFEPDGVELVLLSPVLGLDAMAAREVDGFLTIAGLPTSTVGEALAGVGARLMPALIPGARAVAGRRPHWRLAVVPRGTYGLNMAVHSLAVPALWLVRADLEVELAEALVAALWAPSSRERLDRGHPAGLSIAEVTALTGISVPLHPGAELYYRENGLLAGPHRMAAPD